MEQPQIRCPCSSACQASRGAAGERLGGCLLFSLGEVAFLPHSDPLIQIHSLPHLHALCPSGSVPTATLSLGSTTSSLSLTSAQAAEHSDCAVSKTDPESVCFSPFPGGPPLVQRSWYHNSLVSLESPTPNPSTLPKMQRGSSQPPASKSNPPVTPHRREKKIQTPWPDLDPAQCFAPHFPPLLPLMTWF